MRAPSWSNGEVIVDDLLDLLTLTLLPDVGPRTLRDWAALGPLADVCRAAGDVPGISAPTRALLESGAARRTAEAELERARKAGVRITGWDDDEYPWYLRQIYDPPAVLYSRGRITAREGAGAVAVVGSRSASVHGVALARAMARELGRAGVTVVSGLARGIDTAAHAGTVEGGGRTVAVLGSGLAHIYPRENEALVDRIVDRGGAVVSEFPLLTTPLPGHFPRRNRVIAGWSRAVVVVEAAQRSGALGTARCALDEGREVFAVPGHPAHTGSSGTNALIRDGARLVRDAADVLAELDLAPSSPSVETTGDPVLAALRADAPASLEELEARCGTAVPDLLAHLTRLELAAQVRRLPGPLFVRTAFLG